MATVTIRDQEFEAKPPPGRPGWFWYYGGVNMVIRWHPLHVLQDPEVGLSVAGIPLERLDGVWGPALVPPPLPADTSGNLARPALILSVGEVPVRYRDS